MPPGQRGFTVEINRDVALVLTGKVAFVDRGEQAFFERSAGFANSSRRIGHGEFPFPANSLR